MQETVYYQSPVATVTTTRFVVGATMYPINGITSVGAVTLPRSFAGWLIAASAAGMWGVGHTSGEGGLVRGIPGVAVMLGLLAVAFLRKSKYAVRVTTAGGQSDALVSADLAMIQAIVAALHQAVAERR